MGLQQPVLRVQHPDRQRRDQRRAASGLTVPVLRADRGLARGAAGIYVEQFGSDIPLVSVEIATAAEARKEQGHEDYLEIEHAYFADAVWDARTDGVFYVSGAIIAIDKGQREAARFIRKHLK